MLGNEFDNLIRRQLENSEKNQKGMRWEKDQTWRKIELALNGNNSNKRFSKKIFFAALTLLLLSSAVSIFYWRSMHVYKNKIIRTIVTKKNNEVKNTISSIVNPHVSVRKKMYYVERMSKIKAVKVKDTTNKISGQNIIADAHIASAISLDTHSATSDNLSIKTTFIPSLIEDFRFRDKADSIKYANTKFLENYEKDHPNWKQKKQEIRRTAQLEKQGERR